MGWLKDAWDWTKRKAKELYNDVKEIFTSKGKDKLADGLDKEAEEQRRIAVAKAIAEAEAKRKRIAKLEQEQREEQELILKEKERLRRENERRAKLKQRSSLIHEYQLKIATQAVEYETTVQLLYVKTYSVFINELEKYMDVRPIRKFIDEKMKVFENMMRDEVLVKVSLQNLELNALMDDVESSIDEYCKKINDFADKVYYSARENLLKCLKKIIEDTNNYINVYANKYIVDITQEAKEHKDNLEKLSQEGDVRDAQLLKTASEYSTLVLIKFLAEQEID